MGLMRARAMPCAIHAPGREVTQFVVEGRNVPGTLATIASKLAQLGINILSGLIVAEPGRETGHIVLFLDMTGTGLTEAELLERLRKLDVVVDAEITAKKIGDMAINGTTHRTLFMGERAVLFDVDDIGVMFGWFDENFGSGAHAILFDMGKQAGKTAAEKLMNDYGLRGRDVVEAFLALHEAAGWFDYEVVKYDEGALEFVIRLYDNFECVPFKGKKDRPVSHLVRGELAGLFSSLFKRDFKVDEVMCLAKGDPYCEFTIMPREGR